DGLTACDRQSPISVSGAHKGGLNEIFPRHFVHRAQHSLVGNSAPTQGQQELHMIITLLTAWSFCHVRAPLPALLPCLLEIALNSLFVLQEPMEPGGPRLVARREISNDQFLGNATPSR